MSSPFWRGTPRIRKGHYSWLYKVVEFVTFYYYSYIKLVQNSSKYIKFVFINRLFDQFIKIN